MADTRINSPGDLIGFKTGLQEPAIDDFTESNHVDCPSFTNTGEVTVMAWVKPGAAAGLRSIIDRDPASGERTWQWRMNSANMEYIGFTSGGAFTATFGDAWHVQNWQFVAGRTSLTHATAWAKGTKVETALTGTPSSYTFAARIGDGFRASLSAWNGSIAFAYIFDAAVPDDWLRRLHNREVFPPDIPFPVLCGVRGDKFDDGSPTSPSGSLDPDTMIGIPSGPGMAQNFFTAFNPGLNGANPLSFRPLLLLGTGA